MPKYLFSQQEPIEIDPGRIEQYPSIVGAKHAATEIAADIDGAVYIYRLKLDYVILPPTENPTRVTATSSGPDHHKPKVW